MTTFEKLVSESAIAVLVAGNASLDQFIFLPLDMPTDAAVTAAAKDGFRFVGVVGLDKQFAPQSAFAIELPPETLSDIGDQFIALQKGRRQAPDDGRHFGLVVDDKERVRQALAAAGVETLPGPFLDFLDPWGNRIEIAGYNNIQFTKAPNVLRGMGLAHLSKNESAIKELAEKGMAPD